MAKSSVGGHMRGHRTDQARAKAKETEVVRKERPRGRWAAAELLWEVARQDQVLEVQPAWTPSQGLQARNEGPGRDWWITAIRQWAILVRSVDSGAAHSVIPKDAAPEFTARQDKQSGTVYESATGESI
eukprot:5790157-Amphidinium_carterae.1